MKIKIYELPQDSSDPGAIEVVGSQNKWDTTYDTEETYCYDTYEEKQGSRNSKNARENTNETDCDLSELVAAYKTNDIDLILNPADFDDDDDESAEWFLNTFHSSDSFNASKRSRRKLKMIGGHSLVKASAENNAMLEDIVPLALELDNLSSKEIEEEVVFCTDTSGDDNIFSETSVSSNSNDDEVFHTMNDAVASLCVTPRAQDKLLDRERQKKKSLVDEAIDEEHQNIELELHNGNNGNDKDEIVVVDAVVRALRKSKRKSKKKTVSNSNTVSSDVMEVLKSLELMDGDLQTDEVRNAKDLVVEADESAIPTQASTPVEQEEKSGLIEEIDSFSIDEYFDNSLLNDGHIQMTTSEVIEAKTKQVETDTLTKPTNKSMSNFSSVLSSSFDVTASTTSLSSLDECHISSPPQLKKETIKIAKWMSPLKDLPPLGGSGSEKMKKKMLSWKKKDRFRLKKEDSISSFKSTEKASESKFFPQLALNNKIRNGRKEKSTSFLKENSFRKSRKTYSTHFSSFSFSKQDQENAIRESNICMPDEISRRVHWDEQQLASKEEKGILIGVSNRSCRSIRVLERHLQEIAAVQNEHHGSQLKTLIGSETTSHGYIC